MGKNKYIIEVDDKYVFGTVHPRKLLCPLSIGVGGGKEMYLNTGFDLEEYKDPEEPKEEKTECPCRVGQIVVNNAKGCLMVITRINDDMTVNAMDLDGSFHICSIQDMGYTEKNSTAFWLILKMLRELKNRKDNKNE